MPAAQAVEHEIAEAMKQANVGVLPRATVSMNHYDMYFLGANINDMKVIVRPLVDAADRTCEMSHRTVY